MCNLLYLSTDSTEDLSKAEPPFVLAPDNELQALRKVLAYPNMWYLPCRYGGCSCHFRHSMNPDLGFGLPCELIDEDYDEEDHLATMEVHDLLKRLIDAGCRVDMVDLWNEVPPSLQTMQVSLTEVPREAFRFFDGYRFDIQP